MVQVIVPVFLMIGTLKLQELKQQSLLYLQHLAIEKDDYSAAQETLEIIWAGR